MKETIGINIQLPRKTHTNAKIRAIKKGMKLKEYIIFCLDNQREKE